MEYKNVYFLGIGGIGMSALARYFLHGGYAVAGYDRTPSHLTGELEAEGAAVHYEDDVRLIPEGFLDPKKTMVVYTPAVPQDHGEYRYFREHGFCVEKRSQMLGHLAEGKYVMAVAGTHGKTTTSTMVAWLNRALTGGGSAFLGGHFEEFRRQSGAGRRRATGCRGRRVRPVVPAAVSRRGGGHLGRCRPPRHLRDARGGEGGLLAVRAADPAGRLAHHQAGRRHRDRQPRDRRIPLFLRRAVRFLRPQRAAARRGALPLRPGDTLGRVRGCTLGVPGWVNIENAVAAVASVWCAAKAGGTPLDADKLRGALASFSGVKRRFEFYVNTPKQVYMDDYAHHPRELAATLTSVRKMFPRGGGSRRCSSPHLYTRTRDLHAEFAEALSHADEVVLLPIYPAREEPIPGVASEIIADRVTIPCRIVGRERLADEVAAMDTDVVISFGAGNIDACCEAIAEKLRAKS